jgi:hypothetical protein
MKVTTSYPSTHKLESGQSIILIVFSMIALFGIGDIHKTQQIPLLSPERWSLEKSSYPTL